ncbi:MAG: PEP-utilizing enzyme [Candidatus Hodarchaeota archaeon]
MKEQNKKNLRITLKGWAANSTLRSEGYAFIAFTPKEARDRIKKFKGDPQKLILVCPSIDWSWSDIVNSVGGVVADHGTRVSRGSEVSGIVQVAAVLGTKDATRIIKEGNVIEIINEGNEALAKVFDTSKLGEISE